MEPNTEKQELRARMLEMRRALSQEYRAAQSAALCARLEEHLAGALALSGSTVAVYQALRDEARLDALVEALYAHGARVAFPCTRSGEHLDFYAVSEAAWRAGEAPFLAYPGRFFPTEEFPAFELVASREIDALVVPATAFDEGCMRLGMGAGCYDRFLPLLRGDCLVAGAAFDEQIVARIPADAHDLPVPAVVTPTRTLTPDPAFDAIAYINEPRWMQVRPGLERISELLERLGRPQDRLRFVHVAGTNGKGSVCSFIARALECAGYRTGLFTSPYLIRFEERIRVDGADIDAAALDAATRAVRQAAEAMAADGLEHPTEFELMCAVAFVHFARQRCDVVVAEVGLGGRLDATNVIEHPEVCVIARIGLDHTELLGDTLALVAGEKAGIVKPGAPVVSWPQEPEAASAIVQVCAEQGCTCSEPDFAQLSVEPLDGSMRRRFTYRGAAYGTGLLGSYQPYNAALAIEALRALAARGWNIGSEAIAEGIATCAWPGRFEIAATDPVFIVDGGHNPQGAHALATSLADLGDGVRPIFLCGVLADKDHRTMLAEIVPLARAFVCVAPPNPRALAPEDLAAEIRSLAPANLPVECAASITEGVERAYAFAEEQTAATPEDAPVICAFGSLYSIGEIKRALAARSA